MEKANFTSRPIVWTQITQRFIAMAVMLCCFGLQIASAGHVYTPEGAQTDTPYDADDRATYTVAQPGTTVLFADGITTVLTAQGMNCGTMTYPFFDAGGVGAPFSDEAMDQAFTVCPNSAMNQAIAFTYDFVLLGAPESLNVFDGDDTDDAALLTFTGAAGAPAVVTGPAAGAGTYPGTVTAGASGMADGTGCLTFQLTGLDGLSDAEGIRGSLSMTEFANRVTINGLDGNNNGIANQDTDEVDGTVANPGNNVDGNLIVEVDDCGDVAQNQSLNVTFDCGTPGSPFFLQLVQVNGARVPFLYGAADGGDPNDDDVAPASGTGVSADAATTTILGANLPVGANEVCVSIFFDTDNSGTVNAGDVQKAEDCFEIVVSSTEPLACNDNLNIGLDGDCVVEITPDVVLESPCDEDPALPSNYEITLTLLQPAVGFMNPQAVVLPGITGNGTANVSAQIPGRYRYSITLGDNTCWGFLNLEDKRGPVCAPAGDLEIPVQYDRDCDGTVGDEREAGLRAGFSTDPSGDDDLAPEYVLCTVLDAAEELAPDGISIFFDELEAMDGFVDYNGNGTQQAGEPSFEGDFFDCTGIQTIFFRDEVTEVCELSDLAGFPIDVTGASYDVNRFEVCNIYSRTWFAIDKNGFQSTVGCTQFIFGLRPKASEIQLTQSATVDCGFDVTSDCFQQSTAPFFFVTGGIINEGQGSTGPVLVRDVCAGNTATVATADKRYVLPAGEHTCKYAVSFHEDDQQITLGTDANGDPSCRKATRYWSVIDWCDGSRVYESFAQLLKVEDTTAPTLISENGRRIQIRGGVAQENLGGGNFRDYVINLGTKLFDCEASGNLPAVTIADNCSAAGITRVTIERTDAGTGETGENIFINNVLTDSRGDRTLTTSVDGFDLTLGTYVVEYFFVDDCGNAGSIAIPAVFGDNRVPAVTCSDEVVVTLVPTGIEGDQQARIYPEDIDAASRDNCFPVIRQVRLGDGSNQPFGEFVEFDCTDITPSGADATIKVELRVSEDRNNNGRVDVGELSNVCWTFIRIEDKTPPIIDLVDGVFDCNDPELNGLQLTEGVYTPGADNTDALFPTFVGGCSTEGITVRLVEVDDSGYDPICKVGTFERTFRATRTVHDNQISGNQLTQVITVNFISNWTMQFPEDKLVVCDDAVASNLDNVPAPSRIEDILNNRGCDQWGMEVEDDIFDIIGQDGDGACFKIVRTYKFINWCTWDPTNSEEGIVIRPLDFFTDLGLRVTLDYRSAPVTNICALQNDIDDRFERSNDIYDLKVGNNGNNVAEFSPADGLYETDADWIYFDEGYEDDDNGFFAGPVGGGDFFGSGDCIDGTFGAQYNALFEARIDFDPSTGNSLVNDEQTHNFVSAEAYGYFIYRQIIKVTDNEAPVIDPIDDFTVCDDTNANGNCTVNVTLPLPTVDECKPTYTISYELDANNDGTVDVRRAVRGNAVDGFIAPQLTNIPYGTHGIRYIVEDGCGNNNLVDFTFTAMDCKAPTAYCVIGVNIELMPTGMVEIWASDVDAGSFDDCSEPVTLSFSPNPADSGLIFTCDQRGSNFVQLWVTDAAGNQSFCETIVNVQSNDTDECGVGAAIAGGATTEMGEDVEGVEVRLSGNSEGTFITDVDGAFTFAGLDAGNDYTVTPEKDINYLNGVSTFDLVLIRKHIIGTATLDSPYKLIAADVDNNGRVSILDLVKLRSLILNIDTELENNTSWRFVDKAYAFPTPSNPWVEAFPEVANFNNIAEDMNAADFIAVKIGDVNNSAIPNMLLGSDERTSNEALAINVANATVAAGEEVTVDFTADMVDVAGYQFTLNFDNNVLDLVEIVEGAATAENFGTTLANEGTITTSFDGEVAADQVLFSLTFAAKASANLSELISVSSAVTTAEAYKANEVLNVALNFGGATQTAGFELFQNTPNPFNGVTTISFNLPTAGAATLTVSDVTGKVLTATQAEYAKGLNQVQFSSAQLGATGVLYYTLETADFTATKKMIIVE